MASPQTRAGASAPVSQVPVLSIPRIPFNNDLKTRCKSDFISSFQEPCLTQKARRTEFWIPWGPAEAVSLLEVTQMLG